MSFGREKAQSLRSQALSIIEEVALAGAKSAEPIEGAHEILQTSRKFGLKIGILLRNTRKSVLLTVKKCKFEQFIDVVIAREDCERYKPDSLPVIEMVKRLGINPQEGLFVGDHPLDVLAGKGAGVLAIGVSTGFPSKEDLAATEPDYLRSNLADVRTLMISLVTKNE